jgi:hypothetical protein
MKRKETIALDHKELSEAATDYLRKIKVLNEAEAVITADAFDEMDFEVCANE